MEALLCFARNDICNVNYLLCLLELEEKSFINNFRNATPFLVVRILTVLMLALVIYGNNTSSAATGTTITASGPVALASPTATSTRTTQASSNGQTLTRDFSLPVPLFSSDSAWNQKVTDVKVLPKSKQQILVTYRVLRGDTSTLSPGTGVPYWPFMHVNYDEYTIPVFRMGEG